MNGGLVGHQSSATQTQALSPARSSFVVLTQLLSLSPGAITGVWLGRGGGGGGLDVGQSYRRQQEVRVGRGIKH